MRASRFLLVAVLMAAAASSRADESAEKRRQHTMDEVLAIPADNVRDALDSKERPAADRARDAIENGEAILRDSGLERGMRVAELHAGDGYLSRLIVVAVRRFGRLWANNDPQSLDESTAKAWKTRLEDPVTGDIARLDLPLTAPIPPYAIALHRVYSVGAYHDAVARGIDRAAMNKTVFDAMLPGGRYVIVDGRAADEDAAEAAAPRCRTPEPLVRREVEAAGFRFVLSSPSLQVRSDSAAAAACESPATRPFDRFLLVFEKPKTEE